jgi:hypothetical protein
MLEPDDDIQFHNESEVAESFARYDSLIKADLQRRHDLLVQQAEQQYKVVQLIDQFKEHAMEQWSILETRKFALETMIMRSEPVCECGHKQSKHGKDGCSHERGDSYSAGFAPVALGPCGCEAFTLEGE